LRKNPNIGETDRFFWLFFAVYLAYIYRYTTGKNHLKENTCVLPQIWGKYSISFGFCIGFWEYMGNLFSYFDKNTNFEKIQIFSLNFLMICPSEVWWNTKYCSSEIFFYTFILYGRLLRWNLLCITGPPQNPNNLLCKFSHGTIPNPYQCKNPIKINIFFRKKCMIMCMALKRLKCE